MRGGLGTVALSGKDLYCLLCWPRDSCAGHGTLCCVDGGGGTGGEVYLVYPWI